MKQFLISILIIFQFSYCFSQKLYKEEIDILKVKGDKNIYIGKPLKDLLKEIQPPIKRVIATPSININSYVGNLSFNFHNQQGIDSILRLGKTPITLVVLVKEYFDWDFHKRPKGKETIWTIEDERKYGILTIVGFRIYGDTTIAN